MRYKVLTFFFEGVPTPDGKVHGAEEDPNIIILTNTKIQDVFDSDTRISEPDQYGQRISSVHDVAKNCSQCHTDGFDSDHLKVQPPDLCYSCHMDFHREKEYLHGPLNVGECVFCHNPHQSVFIHLQQAPQPQLCYRCHLQESVATIPGHRERLETRCTDCHDPHGSSGPGLLKPGWEEKDVSSRVDPEIIK